MMLRVVYSELFKIRTIGLPKALFGISIGITLLFAVLKATRAGSLRGVATVDGSLTSASGLSSVIASPDWVMVIAIVFGVTVATGEFRHHTATATYLAVPDRGRVLLAKIVASAAAGLLLGLAASIVSTAVGLSFVAAHGDKVALGTGTIIRYAAGDALGCALLAAVGAAVGSLVRSQLAGIIAVLGWSLVVEAFLDAMFNSEAPYLPFGAARSLAQAPVPDGGTPLPFAGATGVVLGVAIVIALAATRISLPRDIS